MRIGRALFVAASVRLHGARPWHPKSATSAARNRVKTCILIASLLKASLLIGSLLIASLLIASLLIASFLIACLLIASLPVMLPLDLPLVRHSPVPLPATGL